MRLLSLFNKSKNETINLPDEWSQKYTDLAPVDDIPTDSEYFSALEGALKQDKIMNIALAGPYGSGKSSIINSFLKNYDMYKKESLTLSLAEFNESVDESQNDDTDSIERGILKQLFYRVDHKRIPQSRYRKLHVVSKRRVYLSILALLGFVFGLSLIISPNLREGLSNRMKSFSDSFGTPKAVSYLLLVTVVLIILYPLSKVVAKMLPNSKIKEIKISNNTLLESRTDSESVFDKNIDEIMYFFEVTNYRIVFFEDLDRFNDTRIFVKLRELNSLLNNDENIKRRIVFVYAVKDDIFEKDNRTKFFEFIIPVIPVVNPTNSGDMFIDKLCNEGYNVSREFLLDISPFINDMRILNNICNEFIVYRKTLSEKQKLNLKDEEMLALIVFKNLYPKDFADLQNEEGIVKQAFNSINTIRKAVTLNTTKAIESDKKLIDSVEEDTLKAEQEIKIVMLAALTEWNGYVTSLSIDYNNFDSKTFTLSEIMSESFGIDQLRNIKRVSGSYTLWNNMYSYSLSTGRIEIITAFITRWENILHLADGHKEDIKKRIEINKETIREINNYSLKQLLIENSSEQCLPAAVLQNKLLLFMLRRGYINEQYANYINYFKGTSLTQNDMNFILSIKNQEPLHFNFSLTKTDVVISRLQEFEFKNPAIYNFDLLEKLLSTNKYSSKLEVFVEQLVNDKDSWNFIDEFIYKTNNANKFIGLLSAKNDGFWSLISKNSSLTYDRQVKYLKMFFEYADIKDIENNNADGSITDFMTENEDVLQKLYDISSQPFLQPDKLKSIIQKLNIKFKCLSIDGVPSEIINYIFDDCFYILNKQMIKLVVETKDSTLVSDIDLHNYTTIKRLGYKPLVDYIMSNLDEYMDALFFDEKNTGEDIESILELIDIYLTNDAVREHIINHERFCVDNLEDFCGGYSDDKNQFVKKVYDQLLSEKKVFTSWHNTVVYRERFGLSQVLIDYINNNVDSLLVSDNSDLNDDFITELISQDDKTSVLEKILRNNKFFVKSESIKNIPSAVLVILIDLGQVKMSLPNYTSIEKTHHELIPHFILQNQEEFTQISGDIELTIEQLIELLSDKQSSKMFMQHIVDVYTPNIMDEKLAKVIVKTEVHLSRVTFLEMWVHLPIEDKNQMLLKNIDILSCGDFEMCFNVLSEYYPGFADRTRKHKVELEYSDVNMKLAEHLKKCGYITSIDQKEDVNKIKCYIKAN